jgi:hypothetical protein
MITVLIIIAIIALLVLVGIESPKSAIQRKLKGSWNVEIDSCIVLNRECNCCVLISEELSWCDILIDVKSKNIIELPCGNRNIRENTGTWKVTNTNPDSVFFDVPKNPLHGKYAVSFYRGITLLGKYGYKMELSNDSTLLICSKGGIMFDRDVRDW